MTAIASGRELYICLSLFKDTDHRKISLDSPDRIRDDAASLIANQIWSYASPLHLCDKLRTSVSCPLLCAGGGEINIVFRQVAFCQKFLTCLKKSHDRTFCVGGSAPPGLSFRDIS